MKNNKGNGNMTWGFGSEAKMGGNAASWPVNPEGAMDKAVRLTSTGGNPFDSELDVNLLEAFGIPTVRRNPGDGSFGKVIMGSSGFGTEIYVPESMLEDARAILSGEGIVEVEDTQGETLL